MGTGESSKNNGFSLIEVLVAIFILSIIFIFLMATFPYALNVIQTARNETVASYLAQEKIEELYQAGYNNIGTSTIEVRQPISGENSYRQSFEREASVVYVDSDLNDSAIDLGMKKITVTVYYKHGLAKTYWPYTLTTIITDR